MKIEKVNINQNGGCYNCKDSYWDEKTNNLKYMNQEVNSFIIGQTVIRLCDKCLNELKDSILESQKKFKE